MEEILSLVQGRCEQAEVYRVWHRETPAAFEANRLKHLQTKETSGMALRLVKNGRIGFSATNDPEDVPGLVERALELSQFGPEAKFELPGRQSYPDVDVFDESTEQFDMERMFELGQSMIDTVRRENQDVLCEAEVSKAIVEVEVMNSRGAQAKYKKSVFDLGVEGTLIRGTDMLFVGDHRASVSPIVDTRPITGRVLEQLRLARETVEAPAGKLPVLFTPHGVASAFIGPLAVAFNGKTVLQGASPLVGKLGHKLLDERISLWDDATVAHRPASRMFDGEGVPARKLPLVAQGRAVAFYYDLQTAGMAGTQSTGHGARSLGSLPYPSIGLLIMKEGDAAFADMVRGMKDGLLVERLLGAGQGNVLGGEFGGNVLLGYRIRNGEIAGRVKDTVISGNVYEVLNQVIAIGSEAEWIGGGLCVPPIMCDGVSVSTKD